MMIFSLFLLSMCFFEFGISVLHFWTLSEEYSKQCEFNWIEKWIPINWFVMKWNAAVTDPHDHFEILKFVFSSSCICFQSNVNYWRTSDELNWLLIRCFVWWSVECEFNNIYSWRRVQCCPKWESHSNGWGVSVSSFPVCSGELFGDIQRDNNKIHDNLSLPLTPLFNLFHFKCELNKQNVPERGEQINCYKKRGRTQTNQEEEAKLECLLIRICDTYANVNSLNGWNSTTSSSSVKTKEDTGIPFPGGFTVCCARAALLFISGTRGVLLFKNKTK